MKTGFVNSWNIASVIGKANVLCMVWILRRLGNVPSVISKKSVNGGKRNRKNVLSKTRYGLTRYPLDSYYSYYDVFIYYKTADAMLFLSTYSEATVKNE